MPIYEYACHACGHELEIIQKMADLPLEQCPVCHQSTLKKKISAAGFRLKGSGWYETDFKNKPKPTNKPADKDESNDKNNKMNSNEKNEKIDTSTSSSDNTSGCSTSTTR